MIQLRRYGELMQRSRTIRDDGTAELPYTTYPIRRFVNIIVKNDGKEKAIDCEVTLRLLNKTMGCEWLSGQEKSLCWDNGETRSTIGARGNKATFHLAFSQGNFTPRKNK
jgi:hypothetical protein